MLINYNNMAKSKLFKLYSANPLQAYKDRTIHRRIDGTIEYIYRYKRDGSYAFKCIGENINGVIFHGLALEEKNGRFFYQFANTWEKKMWEDIQGKDDDAVKEILYDKYDWYFHNY